MSGSRLGHRGAGWMSGSRLDIGEQAGAGAVPRSRGNPRVACGTEAVGGHAAWTGPSAPIPWAPDGAQGPKCHRHLPRLRPASDAGTAMTTQRNEARGENVPRPGPSCTRGVSALPRTSPAERPQSSHLWATRVICDELVQTAFRDQGWVAPGTAAETGLSSWGQRGGRSLEEGWRWDSRGGRPGPHWH